MSTVRWRSCPTLPGADLLVVVGGDRAGRAGGGALCTRRPRGSRSSRSCATTPPARSVTCALTGARGARLDVGDEALADAWYLAHALIAAESLGAVQTCLDVSVAYAKERFTFGRAIGSYQSIKHELDRGAAPAGERAAACSTTPAGRAVRPEEFPLAASAARSAAGEALDFAARAMINVHGGIGATWEHDAPLFFRRAQLSRRLLGGTRDATDRVAERCSQAAAA